MAFLNNEACTGVPSFSSIVSVNGNGNYASKSFTPQSPGTYRWEASYSGDSDNNGLTLICGTATRTLTVSSAGPPSQPQSHPPCMPCSPLASLTFDSPIVWLAFAGDAGVGTRTTGKILRERIPAD